MNPPDISIVVPLYDEEDSISVLHDRITAAMQRSGLDYEIIFVDDGSRDNTLAIAKKIVEQDSRLRVIEFRGNYGQTPAMAAGIDLASGRVIATMDGDLQNDPSDIPEMYARIDDNIDMVVGWRKNRKDAYFTRKVPSMVANWLIGKVTGVPIRDNGCSLKLYRASMIKKIPLYSEMHRFIPAMASIAGTRVVEVPVKHHARQFGESKYGLSRVYKVLLDLMTIRTITGFAHKPLLWFGFMALPCLIVGCILLIASFAELFTPGGTLILPFAGSGILFATLALFLILCGALGELIYATGDVDFTALSRASATTKFVEGTRTPKRKIKIREKDHAG